MSSTIHVSSTKASVQRILYATRNLELEDGRLRLRQLLQQLESLSIAGISTLPIRLEVEFYSIVHSHPKLRQAMEIADNEELVEIGEQWLIYYAELQKQRPLSTIELKELRGVENEWERLAEELNRMRQSLIEDSTP